MQAEGGQSDDVHLWTTEDGVAVILPEMQREEAESETAVSVPSQRRGAHEKEGEGMTHRWTDEDLKLVKAKRVRGGQGIPTKKSDRSNLSPSPKKPQYKSKLELAWATRLEVMRREGEIDGWLYEPFTFRLAEGKRYRVDFLAWGERTVTCQYGHEVKVPCIIAYECKGWHKNFRDSLTHLKWAAQRFPFFQWKKVVRNGKSGFEVYDVVV